MGLNTTNPAIGPTTSPWAHPSRSTPTGVVSSLRLVKRQDENTRITITQTLPRPSSTWVATATLHGDFPATPPARSTGGVSNGQIGAIIGATSATLIGILVVGWYCLRKRRKGQSLPKSSRSTISPFSSPPSSPRPIPPRTHSSYVRPKVQPYEGLRSVPPGPDFSKPPIPPSFNGQPGDSQPGGSTSAPNFSGPPIPPTYIPNFQNSSSNHTFHPQSNVPRSNVPQPNTQSSQPFGEQPAPTHNSSAKPDSKPEDSGGEIKGQGIRDEVAPQVINVDPGPSTRDRQGSESHRATAVPKASSNNIERSRNGKQGNGPVSAGKVQGHYESRPKESNKQPPARAQPVPSSKPKAKSPKVFHDQKPPNAPVTRARRDTSEAFSVSIMKYVAGRK
ncbi:uncharacterized protein CTRU02_205786 [Colletotrichum truncatum]|uniref:Uncharacterized protein n=1 Tax=Colletotrichum truncatum TaxID=5467 RepID=A0ACC3Z4Z6_COLTU|nr:uncharacterized protein CTRU02_15611 [Colletotrichum truncatum]KAF6780859.1 hypothetical protein CTRU02_15611 [Colletotrichum truncatum]